MKGFILYGSRTVINYDLGQRAPPGADLDDLL